MKFLENKYLIFISRLVVGFILVIAAVTKIAEPEAFAKSILAYKLIPLFLVNIVAIIIPWIELIIGIFLIFGIFLGGSSLLSAGLFCMFAIIIAISLLRGLEINCGCFGADTSPLGWKRFYEDIGLIILSIHVFLFSKSR